MDRKHFIQTSALGFGMALIPQLATSQQLSEIIPTNNKLVPKIIKDKEGEILNVIGDIQTHKLVGSDTNNQLVEWVDNVEPGVGIPPHIHTREDEIFRVVKGAVEIMIDGSASVLKAGDIVFAPKNVPHSWKVVGTEKAKMISTAFPAGIEKMFKELASLPPGPPEFEKVAEICGKHGITFI